MAHMRKTMKRINLSTLPERREVIYLSIVSDISFSLGTSSKRMATAEILTYPYPTPFSMQVLLHLTTCLPLRLGSSISCTYTLLFTLHSFKMTKLPQNVFSLHFITPSPALYLYKFPDYILHTRFHYSHPPIISRPMLSTDN